MRTRNRERFLLFSYFAGPILAGSILLVLPISWNGPTRLPYLDALFT